MAQYLVKNIVWIFILFGYLFCLAFVLLSEVNFFVVVVFCPKTVTLGYFPLYYKHQVYFPCFKTIVTFPYFQYVFSSNFSGLNF